MVRLTPLRFVVASSVIIGATLLYWSNPPFGVLFSVGSAGGPSGSVGDGGAGDPLNLSDVAAAVAATDGATAETSKLCVVVPFRDRWRELDEFMNTLPRFLEAQNVEFEVFVVNQADPYRFNRGALLNAGFLLARETCACFAFHDVGLLPVNHKLDYHCPKKRGVFHVSAPGIHPKYKYHHFIGGIVIASRDDYEELDGFSTRFWGWGKEDDEYWQRILEHKMPVNRPTGITTGPTDTFRHAHSGSDAARDKVRTKEQAEFVEKMYHKVDTRTGLSAMDERWSLRHMARRGHASGYHFMFADVQLLCDEEDTPWCVAL